VQYAYKRTASSPTGRRPPAPAIGVVLDWAWQLPGPVAVTYEAGPTGFGLARPLASVGIRTVVVAPSKLERPPGDRVKTDRRDARRLSRLLHIGEVPGVRVPTVVEEDARDLVRAREATRADLMRARHRVSKLLLRHGIVYYGGAAWTGEHDRWLRTQRFDLPGTRAAFDEAFDTVLATAARRDRLDQVIKVTAADPVWAPMASRLAAVRGIATLTGLGLAVEIGDWDRFTGTSIGAYLGLVPTESSSGTSRSQGSITKTGNTPTPAGCWSRPPGTTSARCGPQQCPGRAPGPEAVREPGVVVPVDPGRDGGFELGQGAGWARQER
jgi:transposase